MGSNKEKNSQTHTKIEAKRLRVATFAIKKMEEQ